MEICSAAGGLSCGGEPFLSHSALTLPVMNITALKEIESSFRGGRDTGGAGNAIERALAVLTEAGISYEVVDRCPTHCAFCDETLPHAA